MYICMYVCMMQSKTILACYNIQVENGSVLISINQSNSKETSNS